MLEESNWIDKGLNKKSFRPSKLARERAIEGKDMLSCAGNNLGSFERPLKRVPHLPSFGYISTTEV
jgi:hypothetical protein